MSPVFLWENLLVKLAFHMEVCVLPGQEKVFGFKKYLALDDSPQ